MQLVRCEVSVASGGGSGGSGRGGVVGVVLCVVEQAVGRPPQLLCSVDSFVEVGECAALVPIDGTLLDEESGENVGGHMATTHVCTVV